MIQKSKTEKQKGIYHVLMDDCGNYRILYQRVVWICQHLNLYNDFEFWHTEGQYFAY